MILGGVTPVRRIGYRGYLLTILTSGRVQISTLADADVICTEADRITAERAVDQWIAAK